MNLVGNRHCEISVLLSCASLRRNCAGFPRSLWLGSVCPVTIPSRSGGGKGGRCESPGGFASVGLGSGSWRSILDEADRSERRRRRPGPYLRRNRDDGCVRPECAAAPPSPGREAPLPRRASFPSPQKSAPHPRAPGPLPGERRTALPRSADPLPRRQGPVSGGRRRRRCRPHEPLSGLWVADYHPRLSRNQWCARFTLDTSCDAHPTQCEGTHQSQ